MDGLVRVRVCVWPRVISSPRLHTRCAAARPEFLFSPGTSLQGSGTAPALFWKEIENLNIVLSSSNFFLKKRTVWRMQHMYPGRCLLSGSDGMNISGRHVHARITMYAQNVFCLRCVPQAVLPPRKQQAS